MDEAFDLVRREIERQDAMWGKKDDPPADWVSRLGEEFGEVCKANNEYNLRQYIIELSHVAALAIQAIQVEVDKRHAKDIS